MRWGIPKISIGITGLDENLNRDYGIERKFESGLRDWAEILIGITGLSENLGQDKGIEEPY